METDFRTFFLLAKTITEIILKNIPARESLFALRETDFLASGNQFFSPFVTDFWQFFSLLVKRYFIKQNPSFRLVETGLLTRRNSFLLFRVFLRNRIFGVFPRH